MRRALAIGAALTAAIGVLAAPAAAGVKTTKPPYLIPAPGNPAGVTIEPILSTGDIVPNSTHPFGYQMSGIPDGLGSYANRSWGWNWDHGDSSRNRGSKTFNVVMNHELGRNFPNNPPGVDTRISQLTINRSDLSVEFAEYLFKGNEGYERFCSATLMLIEGRPLYFTGEEAVHTPPQFPPHDGSSIVMDPVTGMWRETEHFGHLQHENVLPLRLRKWVFLTTDDDFRPGQPAYLYAYISNSFWGGITGREGSLHVWKADNPAETGNATATKNESIPGTFVPIPQSENLSSAQLKAAATARKAFIFDRLEDVTEVPNKPWITYIADTGKPPATLAGRVYRFEFDRSNPTKATLKMVLNGDAPDNDDIRNPDNMDASEKVLVIQEDREAVFRGVPGGTEGFNRIMVWEFDSKRLYEVARVATPVILRPGTWESSGVDDARRTIGKDWWILDVQAHSTTAPQPGPTLQPNSSAGEDGQLLAIKIPGSQGGGDHDEDDDDKHDDHDDD
jgi:hypothetical protein